MEFEKNESFLLKTLDKALPGAYNDKFLMQLSVLRKSGTNKNISEEKKTKGKKTA
ncbi:MAG: hypothetical protein SWH68_06340 [Thermodesulfobacteriota bacterium]|nr:hypothetical protein [Thermodesulfobacteriota bacterium]